MTDALRLTVRSELDQQNDRRSISRRVVLGDSAWLFEYKYSRHEDRWYLNIASEDGTALVGGLAMCLGSDILAPYHHLDIPTGRLWVRDTSNTDVDPALDGFDERCWLLYAEAV